MPSNKKRKKETKKPEVITDPKLIEELDKQPLYSSPSETAPETFDTDLLANDRLKKSAEKVGYESPILVAVWLDDPNKDSETSEERVNMRIIEGRHRYEQDKNWPRKYILVTSVEQLWEYQLNFSIRKKDNQAELKARLTVMGEHLRKKGTPLEKISSELCKRTEGIYSPQKVLDCILQEWKDQRKVTNRKYKTKKKNGKNIHEKCQKKIENLETEVQRKEQQLENLKTEKQNLKKDNEDLKEYIQQLYMSNPELQPPK